MFVHSQQCDLAGLLQNGKWAQNQKWPAKWPAPIFRGAPTRDFGPFGPEDPPPRSARESVPEKQGVLGSVWGSAPGILWGGSAQNVSKKWLKSVQKDTFTSLLEGPQGHFSRHFRAHPGFWRHSLGHFGGGTSGPKGSKTPVRGWRVLNSKWHFPAEMSVDFKFRLKKG